MTNTDLREKAHQLAFKLVGNNYRSTDTAAVEAALASAYNAGVGASWAVAERHQEVAVRDEIESLKFPVSR